MLIFLLLLILIALGLEWLSLQKPSAKLHYQCLPDKLLVEPDEVFHLVTYLDNDSYRPIPFIRMEESLPALLQVENQQLELDPGKGYLSLTSTHFLMPRQRLVRRLKVSLPQRGRYIFRGANLYFGDFLGFRESGEFYPQLQEIVVFPKALAMSRLNEILGSYLGDYSVNRFILEDPMLIVGFQDYTGREAQKTISWPQSLRAGHLMVKKYDHTLEMTVQIILNVAFPANLPRDPALIEACFSLTRSVCEDLESRSIPYGFLTNATAAGAMGTWSRLEDGLGKRHIQVLLEGLGRATYDNTCSFEQLLDKAMRQAQTGQAYLLITPDLPADLGPFVDRLHALTNNPPCILKARDYYEQGDDPSC
jgi:hypothetical protein